MPFEFNLHGQIHGKLTVIDEERDPRFKKKRGRTWYCMCTCGETVRYTSNRIRQGKARSCRKCGNIRKMTYDLTNQRFGSLVAREIMEIPGGKTRRGKNSRKQAWLCECDCGRWRLVTSNNLRDNNVISCGCKNASRKKPADFVWDEKPFL